MMNTFIPLGDAAILDLRQHAVFFRKSKVALTEIEFALMQVLVDRFRAPVSRDDISIRLYGFEWDGLNRTVDVNIARLRRKLRSATKDYLDIRSVRNIGYILIENPMRESSAAPESAEALPAAPLYKVG